MRPRERSAISISPHQLSKLPLAAGNCLIVVAVHHFVADHCQMPPVVQRRIGLGVEERRLRMAAGNTISFLVAL